MIASGRFCIKTGEMEEISVDRGCRVTIRDRMRHCAHVIQAHRCIVRLWKLESLRLVYIPVPKVASSGIRQLLRARQRDEILGVNGDSLVDERALKRQLEEQLKVSLRPAQVQRMGSDYYRFSFVRNPLTRLYSCYRDKVVNAQQRRDRCTLSPYRIHFGMSFEDFIERVAEIPDKYSDQHFRSQSALLVHRGELLVDYWGKLERFAEDWEVLSARFGFDAPARQKRFSGVSTPMHELPLTRGGLSLVMNRFAEDLDHFEYRQDLEALMDELPA